MQASVLSRRALRVTIAAATLLAACESESDPTGPGETPQGPEMNEVLTAGPLNASSTDTLVHFSFASGTLVSRTDDWDVALRRYEVRLNGGVSGTKDVRGYSMGNHQAATNYEVLAFTVSGTLAEFDTVREAQIPHDTAFRSDRLIENTFGFLNLAGVPTANAAMHWKVRTADGGYALFRVTNIALNPQTFALTSITIESRIQTGTTLDAPRTATIAVTGPTNISIVNNGAVTASGCNWDVAVDPQSLEMTVNAGCNVGTYPCPASPTFANTTAANDGSQYAAFLAGLTGAIPNSITNASSPFRYNLEGTNRLHPSFNIYLIRTGAQVFKLQFVNYYGAAGESGHPTIRYARIR
jgi:hypothetical protein